VANDADDVLLRTEAHSSFAHILREEKHGFALLRHLYLQLPKEENLLSARIEDLPDVIRHALVDDALAQADIRLASRLMGDLQHAPKGKSSFQWGLRRARILIMGGDQGRGISALHALLDETPEFSGNALDRLVQVLFDLQSVARHGEAIALFERLLVSMPEVNASTARAGDAKRRREIYYWIADSYKAMEHYQEAARMYLKSAMHLDASAMDPWAQTARYQAADVLARAGFREDAASLYRSLLKVTTDAGRRTVLQNRIQQLWLSVDDPVTDASLKDGLPGQGAEATFATNGQSTP
jgi:tetratricopeptide (TPR) repeat protein